jgi:thiol-disulfide isomerase/thioredoxin
MKKAALYFCIMFSFFQELKGQQTTAMDFTMSDCLGNTHHLFQEMDSGRVIVLEFFMTHCDPCVEAGDKLSGMFLDLVKSYPKKLSFYQFGFSDEYTCTDITNWVNDHNFSFTSVPFDSGDAQVKYYGGFGMPTVVVVGGTKHQVIFSSVGFANKDTNDVSLAIHNFFAGKLNLSSLEPSSREINIYPNPASNEIIFLNPLVNKNNSVINIADALGRILFHQVIYSSSTTIHIPIAHFSEGIYTLKCQSDEGEITQKFVINH